MPAFFIVVDLGGTLAHCASCPRVAAGCMTQDHGTDDHENPEHL